MFSEGSLYDGTSCLAAWSQVPSKGSSVQGFSVQGEGSLSRGAFLSMESLCRETPESEKRAVRVLLECFLVLV